MNELVSVVVPVYNIQEYLSTCVESILAQTYKNIEIILVDDGSTDLSGQISDNYEKKHENIIVVHKDNGGLGFARNTGIENATGDYITFVDGDDFISSDHIENFVRLIGTDNIDACYGGFCQQNGNTFTPVPNPLKGKIFKNKEILQDYFPYLCGKLNYHIADDVQMSSCMVLYKLSIIKDNKIRFHSERELISEDLIFNLDFLEKANKIAVSDDNGYCYQIREGSLTSSYKPDRLIMQTYLTNYIIDRSTKLGIFNKCEQRIYSTYLAWVRAIVQGEQKNYRKIGFKESINRIKNICSDPFVIEIINKYDESNLTTKLKIMNKLIKQKNSLGIWLLSYFKSQV